MADKLGDELFYLDKQGKKQDAKLHAEILGDDTNPWDLDGDDLERIADMSDAELTAFLKQKQG